MPWLQHHGITSKSNINICRLKRETLMNDKRFALIIYCPFHSRRNVLRYLSTQADHTGTFVYKLRAIITTIWRSSTLIRHRQDVLDFVDVFIFILDILNIIGTYCIVTKFFYNLWRLKKLSWFQFPILLSFFCTKFCNAVDWLHCYN